MAIIYANPQDLITHGPVIEIHVQPSEHIIKTLAGGKKQIPTERTIGLIDTGATRTCIDDSIAQALKLKPHDKIKVHTPDGETEQFLYDATLYFTAIGNTPYSVSVLGANLTGQPYGALLGRDFLSLGVLIYSGFQNQWKFCI